MNQTNQGKEEWHRRLLWLAIGAIVTVFITALLSPFINRIFTPLGGHSSSSASPTAISTFSSPTPTVSIYPQLKNSYSGTFTNAVGQSFVLMLSSIVEKQGGEISGNIVWGSNPTSSFKGNVTHDNKISFTFTLVVLSGDRFPYGFTGSISSNGNLAGNWQNQNDPSINGTWTASY